MASYKIKTLFLFFAATFEYVSSDLCIHELERQSGKVIFPSESPPSGAPAFYLKGENTTRNCVFFKNLGRKPFQLSFSNATLGGQEILISCNKRSPVAGWKICNRLKGNFKQKIIQIHNTRYIKIVLPKNATYLEMEYKFRTIPVITCSPFSENVGIIRCTKGYKLGSKCFLACRKDLVTNNFIDQKMSTRFIATCRKVPRNVAKWHVALNKTVCGFGRRIKKECRKPFEYCVPLQEAEQEFDVSSGNTTRRDGADTASTNDSDKRKRQKPRKRFPSDNQTITNANHTTLPSKPKRPRPRLRRLKLTESGSKTNNLLPLSTSSPSFLDTNSSSPSTTIKNNVKQRKSRRRRPRRPRLVINKLSVRTTRTMHPLTTPQANVTSNLTEHQSWQRMPVTISPPRIASTTSNNASSSPSMVEPSERQVSKHTCLNETIESSTTNQATSSVTTAAFAGYHPSATDSPPKNSTAKSVTEKHSRPPAYKFTSVESVTTTSTYVARHSFASPEFTISPDMSNRTDSVIDTITAFPNAGEKALPTTTQTTNNDTSTIFENAPPDDPYKTAEDYEEGSAILQATSANFSSSTTGGENTFGFIGHLPVLGSSGSDTTGITSQSATSSMLPHIDQRPKTISATSRPFDSNSTRPSSETTEAILTPTSHGATSQSQSFSLSHEGVPKPGPLSTTVKFFGQSTPETVRPASTDKSIASTTSAEMTTTSNQTGSSTSPTSQTLPTLVIETSVRVTTAGAKLNQAGRITLQTTQAEILIATTTKPTSPLSTDQPKKIIDKTTISTPAATTTSTRKLTSTPVSVTTLKSTAASTTPQRKPTSKRNGAQSKIITPVSIKLCKKFCKIHRETLNYKRSCSAFKGSQIKKFCVMCRYSPSKPCNLYSTFV